MKPSALAKTPMIGHVKLARYLTTADKEQIIREWHMTLKRWQMDGSPVMPGLGFPDPEILVGVERINELTGICVLQSCTGHRLADDYLQTGCLWIAMEERNWKAFDNRAFDLAIFSTVERVSTLYQQYGRQVLNIQFRGLERSKAAFKRSMSLITWFLEMVEKESARARMVAV